MHSSFPAWSPDILKRDLPKQALAQSSLSLKLAFPIQLLPTHPIPPLQSLLYPYSLQLSPLPSLPLLLYHRASLTLTSHSLILTPISLPPTTELPLPSFPFIFPLPPRPQQHSVSPTLIPFPLILLFPTPTLPTRPWPTSSLQSSTS